MNKKLESLIEDLTKSRLSRRQFISRAAALGLSMSAIGSILAACGGQATTAATETAATEPTSAAATTPASSAGTLDKKPNDGNKYRMAAIHIAPITTGSWDPVHNIGYMKMVKQLGWAEPTLAEAIDYGKTAEILRGYGNQKYDLILATSGGFADPVLEVAPEFPDTWFAVVSDMPTTKDLPNVVGYNARMEELGYMVGAFLALATKSDIIGADCGVPIFAINKQYAGIIEGAKAVNPDLKFTASYSGDWVDTAKIRESTLALIDKGVTVMQVNQTGEQITFQACKEKGVWATSYFLDRYDDFPTVLGSGMWWDFDRVYREMFQGIMDATLEPKLYECKVTDGWLGLLPTHDKLPADKEAKLQGIVADLKSGKTVVPDLKPYEPEGAKTEG